jgi:kynurenine formamidase
MPTLIDLSHTVEHGLITYKGLPAPIVCDFLSREDSRRIYAPGTEFHIGKIEMVANTGTYVDSPFHRYADGKDLSELPLESLANLAGIVVHHAGRAIGRSVFGDLDLRGKAVLVHTGWDRHWATDQYFEGHPFLTEAAARHIANSGAALASIRLISTIRPTCRGRRIPSCCAPAFPSPNICATWNRCRREASGFSPCR